MRGRVYVLFYPSVVNCYGVGTELYCRMEGCHCVEFVPNSSQLTLMPNTGGTSSNPHRPSLEGRGGCCRMVSEDKKVVLKITLLLFLVSLDDGSGPQGFLCSTESKVWFRLGLDLN